MANWLSVYERADFLKPKIILTCEHGGSYVPRSLKVDFSNKQLSSHRSYDYGAADICEFFKNQKKYDVHINKMSRWLIDMNRQLSAFEKNKKLAQLSSLSEKDFELIKSAYTKYRQSIWTSVKKCIDQKQDFYVFSVHSFTPVMNGKARKTDIGLLYRTTNPKEVLAAKGLRKNIENSELLGAFKTHFNLPYRGHTDCLLNDLLNEFGNSRYFKGGCFLEFNQNLLRKNASSVKSVLIDYFDSLG